MMSPHDRKALLRAFYGLLTLWAINGFFGLLRAAGPGAAIVYIELGLLIGYWIWVFFWWRTNRPKTSRSAARKSKVRQAREKVDAEVRKAVDLEEAVARERNRRRKAQLQRTAGKVGSQVGSGLNQLRYVIVGSIVVAIAIFGFQEYEANRKLEETAKAFQTRVSQTRQAMEMWDSRNACLLPRFSQRWQEWYRKNPQTQTKTILTFSDESVIVDRTSVTKTLTVPETLNEVVWEFVPSVEAGEPIIWRVTEGHFEELVTTIRFECAEEFPSPSGMSDWDIQKDQLGGRIRMYGLLPPDVSIFEAGQFLERFQWQDVFQMTNDAPQ